jgi:hypothetical protein
MVHRQRWRCTNRRIWALFLFSRRCKWWASVQGPTCGYIDKSWHFATLVFASLSTGGFWTLAVRSLEKMYDVRVTSLAREYSTTQPLRVQSDCRTEPIIKSRGAQLRAKKEKDFNSLSSATYFGANQISSHK